MLEIEYLREEKILNTMLKQIKDTIKDIVKIFDIEYGNTREKYKDDGGYVIVVEC